MSARMRRGGGAKSGSPKRGWSGGVKGRPLGKDGRESANVEAMMQALMSVMGQVQGAAKQGQQGSSAQEQWHRPAAQISVDGGVRSCCFQ